MRADFSTAAAAAVVAAAAAAAAAAAPQSVRRSSLRALGRAACGLAQCCTPLGLQAGARSPLHLRCISAASPLHLPCVSAVSLLHLPGSRMRAATAVGMPLLICISILGGAWACASLELFTLRFHGIVGDIDKAEGGVDVRRD